MDISIASCFIVFGFSFIVALSGAMAPGPLLTYTIYQTLKNTQKGYLVGFFVIAGHAILEGIIIIALLLGFSFVLNMPVIKKALGLIGGCVLIGFGIALIREVVLKRIPDVFTGSGKENKQKNIINNPVIGGVLISMSNPYWWTWWATAGLGFMLKYNISLINWPMLIIFFIGHEFGDLFWYGFISFMMHFGKKRLNAKVYIVLLFICGVIMIGFGLFLGILSFLDK